MAILQNLRQQHREEMQDSPVSSLALTGGRVPRVRPLAAGGTPQLRMQGPVLKAAHMVHGLRIRQPKLKLPRLANSIIR